MVIFEGAKPQVPSVSISVERTAVGVSDISVPCGAKWGDPVCSLLMVISVGSAMMVECELPVFDPVAKSVDTVGWVWPGMDVRLEEVTSVASASDGI